MKNNFTVLAGVKRPVTSPLPAFSEPVLDFLDAVSRRIRALPETAEPELAAFGFWCRRAHMEQLRSRYAGAIRVGRGQVFHVAPGNVPVMFGYSLAAGLLAGSANLVRVSGHAGAAAQALCGILRSTLSQPRFRLIRERTGLITYDRNDAITGALMARCDAAVVWGGDETVAALRRFPMKPGAEFIPFADRRSLAVLSPRALDVLDADGFSLLVHGFYNDTYRMDQDACSSPRLVLWLRDGGSDTVRERFWYTLAAEVMRERYPLDAHRAAEKYGYACRACMELPCVGELRRYGGNALYVLSLSEPPEDPETLCGRFGTFFEAELPGLEGLSAYLTEKTQTVACAGLDRRALAAALALRGAAGVSRVVPVGQALEFDTTWDGKDLIGRLSREISVI